MTLGQRIIEKVIADLLKHPINTWELKESSHDHVSGQGRMSCPTWTYVHPDKLYSVLCAQGSVHQPNLGYISPVGVDNYLQHFDRLELFKMFRNPQPPQPIPPALERFLA